MSATPEYTPTPEEICAACAEIRAGWTPLDWQHRSGATQAWYPPGAEMEPEWTDVGRTAKRMREKLGTKPSWGDKNRAKFVAMEAE